MRKSIAILSLVSGLLLCRLTTFSQQQEKHMSFDFCGDTITFDFDPNALIQFPEPLSDTALYEAWLQVQQEYYHSILRALKDYKTEHKPDDWLYYQLVRRTAQAISPKADNYHRYTFYKWFLMAKSGYDVMLNTSGDFLLFYIHCDENIFNIPVRMKGNQQYVCLNYHDYKKIDFTKNKFTIFPLFLEEAKNDFSYKVTKLPGFHPADYVEKDLQFDYNENNYNFKVKLNTQVQKIFANYPVVDYSSYFNIPLSKETENSLIPVLKKRLKGVNVKSGVEYLMHFTRYAFLFQPDSLAYGGEKRMTAEQTLFSEHSDCEDRASLFFCLVKEIYNLPMLVLNYPKHVTIAVKFDKPVGSAIEYKGAKYSICEPSPQKVNLAVGQMIPELRKAPYEVAYAYQP